jgi:uncharacterized protein
MMLRSVAPLLGRLGSLAILLLALIAAPAIADTLPVPALTGRVVDQAGILNNSEEARLVAKLANLEAKSSIQLVVVTLSSLRGSPIEDWGLTLGRTWGIGQKGKDNGVLLIVAPNDRELRIEVGYGLEGTLPDATADAIIRNVIVPRFRAGSMAGGISDGVDAIIAALGGSGAEFIASGNENFERTVRTLIPFLFAGLFVALVLFSQYFHRSGRRGYRYYRYSNGGWVTYDNDRHGGGWGGGGGFGGGGGGFSGGGGSFGGGGSSGRW